MLCWPRARFVRKKRNAVVAEFAISRQTFEDVTAALVVGFEAAGFVIFEQQVLVVVLAVDDHFHFDQVAAGDGTQIFQRNAFVFRHLLTDHLASITLHADLFVVTFQTIELSIDFDFQTGGGDVVFLREVGQIRTEVNRAFACAADFDFVVAGGDGITFDQQDIVEAEQILAVDLHGLLHFAIDKNFHGHVRLIFTRGLDVVGHGFDNHRGVASTVPVCAVLAIIQKILDQSRSDFVVGSNGDQQLQINGHGFVVAAVPVPPAVLWQSQPGRLVFVVLFEKLFDVLDHHVSTFGILLFVQHETCQRQAVDGQMAAIAVEIIGHRHVVEIVFRQDHRDESVQVVGLHLV
jgi:hypothetical protein